MLKKTLVALVVAFTLTSLATASVTTAPLVSHPPYGTREYIEWQIKQKADFYDVSEEVMKSVIWCESRYNPKAINHTEREYSVGLSQINLYAHNIPKEQAMEIDFSIDFLAKNLSLGKGSMWTCFVP